VEKESEILYSIRQLTRWVGNLPIARGQGDMTGEIFWKNEGPRANRDGGACLKPPARPDNAKPWLKALGLVVSTVNSVIRVRR